MSFAAAGCSPLDRLPGRETPVPELTGAVDWTEPGDEPEIEIETGEVAWPEDGEEPELMGDVAYFPGEESDG